MSSVVENGVGDAGDISLEARNLSLNNNAVVGSAIFSKGNGGQILINATETISLFGQDSSITSAVQVDGVGNAGDIILNTKNLKLNNGAQIFNDIFGEGNGGQILINATEAISLDQENTNGINSIISSGVQSVGVGNAGDIIIDTKNLLLTNGGQIGSGTFGIGNAGKIFINATETISLDGKSSEDGRSTGIASTVEPGGVGSEGEISINTKKLTLTNGGVVSSETFGTGNAGKIFINATETISLDGEDSSIRSLVRPKAVGDGGEIVVNTKNLFLTNGASLTSSTRSEGGDAGSLTVHASDSIKLSGVSVSRRGGLFVSATEGSGNGGDLAVFTDELSVSEGASISASNFSSIEGLREPGTGEAGSVRIEANNLTLENGGRINATTQAGDDGNISLKVAEDIILRDHSLISARAFKEATGGNIDIEARFIVAFPNQNNDIIASASQGKGGEINITTEGIFGLEERSSTPTNETNDIDASSEFGLSGEVSITRPDVDPTSGLLELTEEVVDPAKLIAQNVCTQTADSEFVDIGKGGLPQNPQDRLAEDFIEVGLVAPVIPSSEATEPTRARIEIKPKRTRKPPAQGWIFHDNGIVELVAYNPNQVGEKRTGNNHRGCQN